MPSLKYDQLRAEGKSEKSAAVRERVCLARQIQTKRLAGERIYSNSQMKPKHLKKFCQLETAGQAILDRSVRQSRPERPRISPHTKGRPDHSGPGSRREHRLHSPARGDSIPVFGQKTFLTCLIEGLPYILAKSCNVQGFRRTFLNPRSRVFSCRKKSASSVVPFHFHGKALGMRGSHSSKLLGWVNGPVSHCCLN